MPKLRRELLAKNLALRICEDRGTEDYGRLQKIATGKDAYPRLL